MTFFVPHGDVPLFKVSEVLKMAAATRSRPAYSPVSVEDSPNWNFKPKSKQPPSCLICVVFVCASVVFLLGFCLGFYVRELQSVEDEVLQNCGTKKVESTFDLPEIHDDMMWRVRGEDIEDFMR